MVIFRGVNFYPRQIESLVVGRPGVGHEYQIVLERTSGGGDQMTVLLEVSEGFDPAELRGLARDLKDFLALSPVLRTVREGELPRAAGKAVRVVDRRGG
jgi:phenylacetate-coenzyme A ligase PaaK-like adenylate-forming protein